MARTREIVLEAVKAVKVTYKNHKKPILTIEEALKYPNQDETVTNFEDEEVKEGDVSVDQLEEMASKQGKEKHTELLTREPNNCLFLFPKVMVWASIP